MESLVEVLKQRFGEHRVNEFPRGEDDYIDLITLELELNSPVTVLMTNGLSEYNMPLPPDSMSEEKNVEIFFCLPSYWDLTEETSTMNWPIQVLQKLAKNLIEKETWYAAGHTIANGNPPKQISETMKESRFVFLNPISLEDHLAPISLGDKKISFLSIVPIFENEYHFRINKGFKKFMRKFRLRNQNEIIDDYREDFLHRRWKMI